MYFFEFAVCSSIAPPSPSSILRVPPWARGGPCETDGDAQEIFNSTFTQSLLTTTTKIHFLFLLLFKFCWVGNFDARYFWECKISGSCIFLSLQYVAPSPPPPIKYTVSTPLGKGGPYETDRDAHRKFSIAHLHDVVF